ncbi:PKD repeat protein [Methanocalculus alkaliphilus]|uniref:PKD domain-containing protein n=1 Tax=Methanocalculus alkaliphilus TaxID=768730 RepID=UPI00209F9597|nr:PKD domain-containing protein [Methanocalculus alkaliphilus]MCP1714329.1 PKD repeat protein [Methanocalculus alkaliphilus]
MRSFLLILLILPFICAVGSAAFPTITSDTTTGVAPATITFTGSVIGNEESPADWSWKFTRSGDPSSREPLVASGNPVTITFDRAGTWHATLQVSVDGRHPVSNPYNVMIHERDAVPEPAFTASTRTGTAPLTVTFTDRSTNTPTSWFWGFGDGATGSGQTVTHTYTEPGTYAISQRIRNDAGSFSKTWQNYITVTTPPVAGFTINRTGGEPPFPVAFTDRSTGGIISREWDFGDGTVSDQVNPVHTYTRQGVYTVSLTVVNKNGTATLSRNNLIIVKRQAITDFTANVTTGGVPLTVQFTDLTNGSPNQWRWDFGDGSTSFLQHPEHTYRYPGTFAVSLASSGRQGSGTLRRTGYITVHPPPQTAFDADITFGSAPLSVQFSDRSTGGPAEWIWDFGDGTTSTIRHPSHTYREEGIYPVSLSIRNEYGTDQRSRPEYITVIHPAPEPAIMATEVSEPVMDENRTDVPKNISLEIPIKHPGAAITEYIRLIKDILSR